MGSAGEDLGNSQTPEEVLPGGGRTLHMPGLFPQPSVSPGASLRVLRHLLPKATRLLVLRHLDATLRILHFVPFL